MCCMYIDKGIYQPLFTILIVSVVLEKWIEYDNI
jgi:hypothetical protein